MQNQKIQVLEMATSNLLILIRLKNLWKIIKGKCANKNTTSIDEYYKTLKNEYCINLLKKLVASIPKRCAEVIKNKGYPTKYSKFLFFLFLNIKFNFIYVRQ